VGCGLCAGFLVAYFMGIIFEFPVPSDGMIWRGVVLLPVAIGIIQLLLTLTVIRMDTPRYYLLCKKNEHMARKSLSRIYKEEYLNVELELINVERSLHKSFKVSHLLTKTSKQFWLGVAMAFNQQMTGITAVNSYANTIFEDSGLNPSDASIYSTILAGLNLGAAIFLAGVADRIGRRKPYLVGSYLTCLSVLAIAITIYYGEYIVARFLLLFYIFAYSGSVGTLTYMYIPEMLPVAGVSVIMLLTSCFSAIVSYSYLYLNNWMGGVTGPFLIYGAIGFVSTTYCYFQMIETKDRNFSEVAFIFTKIPNQSIQSPLLKNKTMDISPLAKNTDAGDSPKSKERLFDNPAGLESVDLAART